MAPIRRKKIQGFLREGAFLATAAAGGGLTLFADVASGGDDSNLFLKLLGQLGAAGGFWLLCRDKDKRCDELSDRLVAAEQRHAGEIADIRAETAAERSQFVTALLGQKGKAK